MAKLKPRIWVCDFETTTGAVSTSHTHVWCWAAISLDTNKDIVGQNIAQFIDFIQVACDKIYFHNLKFDGEFLLSFAMRKLGMCYSKERLPNTFDCIISAVGQFYELEFTFQVYKGWKNSVKVYDSLKKLPFSVKTIAEAFHLPIKKGEID